MAEEKTVKQWGRYEHESGAWMQFKPGPYRYREVREWRKLADDGRVIAFIVKRLASLYLPTLDGGTLNLEALQLLAPQTVLGEAPEESDVKRAMLALEAIAGAFDDVDASLVKWFISSASQFAFADMMTAPKA